MGCGQHIARRVRPLRLPPQPPLRKGGQACLRAGDRRLRGEYNLCAYPPSPPFARGGGLARGLAAIGLPNEEYRRCLARALSLAKTNPLQWSEVCQTRGGWDVRRLAFFQDPLVWIVLEAERTPGSTGSPQAVRQTHHRRFDRLATGGSTGSPQAVRQARHRRFDRLTTGGSTDSRLAVRQTHHWRFDRLTTGSVPATLKGLPDRISYETHLI